jgi:hypothetical protein
MTGLQHLTYTIGPPSAIDKIPLLAKTWLRLSALKGYEIVRDLK